MKRVTLWYKEVKNKYEYNHLENGWSVAKKPTPFSPEFINQKSWENDNWINKYGVMDENYRVKCL